MSTPINEAYARIDVGEIQKIKNLVNNLANLIPTGIFARLDTGGKKTDFSIKGAAIYTERINVPGNESKVSIKFGTLFDASPTVTGTVIDSTGNLQNTDSVTVLITKLTKDGVDFFIKKKGGVRCILNVIAIGPNKNA